jgi:outer membrane protein TolC
VRQAERDRVLAEARARGFLLSEPARISGDWTNRHVSEGPRVQNRVLEAGLTLEPLGQGIFRARAASAERGLGLSEVDGQARSWAAHVAWSYYERGRSRWLLRAVEHQSEIVRRLADVVERRFEAGDASGLERSLARVEAAEGSRRLLEAQSLARQDEERLAGAIGWPAGMPLLDPDSSAVVPTFPDTSALLTRALEHRPELRTARAALDLGKADLRLATAQLLPNVEIGAFGGSDGGDDVHGVKADLRLPFLGPALVERGARRAERRRLEAELRAALRDAQAEVAATTEAAALAYRQVTLFRETTLPAVEEARQKYQVSYQLGEVDLTTMLLGEQRYRDAEAAFADALGTYVESLRQLEEATGLPLLSGYELIQETQP